MRQDDRRMPRDGVSGPIEPGSVLHRVLVMVAQEIARSRARELHASVPLTVVSEQNHEEGQTRETKQPRAE
jgi:hypothetical protein